MAMYSHFAGVDLGMINGLKGSRKKVKCGIGDGAAMQSN